VRSAGLFAALLLTFAVPAEAASDPQAWALPDGTHTLVVDMPYATITVVGMPRADLEVRAARDTVLGGPGPRPGAPPRVTAGGPPPVVVVEDRVEILAPGNTTPTLLWIRVPQRFSVQVRGSNGGAVTVQGVRGSIEIENSNAGVNLEDVAGTAVVSTSNGSVTATFTEVAEDGPLSFVTSNGAIDVTLPGGIDARVILETDNGDFFSDFEIRPAATGEPRAVRGRRLEGVIGRGGPVYRFLTSNSDIYLRRRGPG